jgi:hypothetical protein
MKMKTAKLTPTNVGTEHMATAHACHNAKEQKSVHAQLSSSFARRTTGKPVSDWTRSPRAGVA